MSGRHISQRQRECDVCEGGGQVWTSRWGGNDPDTWPIPCPECQEEPDRYDEWRDRQMVERWDRERGL